MNTEWPDDSIPEWLRDIALDPADYLDYCYVQGTAITASGGGWVSWEKGHTLISLDGEFTARQLREIVAMMEANAP